METFSWGFSEGQVKCLLVKGFGSLTSCRKGSKVYLIQCIHSCNHSLPLSTIVSKKNWDERIYHEYIYLSAVWEMRSPSEKVTNYAFPEFGKQPRLHQGRIFSHFLLHANTSTMLSLLNPKAETIRRGQALQVPLPLAQKVPLSNEFVGQYNSGARFTGCSTNESWAQGNDQDAC